MNTLQPGTIKVNTLQPGTIKVNTLQPGTIKVKTLQPGTIKVNTFPPAFCLWIDTSSTAMGARTTSVLKNLEHCKV